MNRLIMTLIPCLVITLAITGCAKKRPRADAEVARQTLRVALDAWKKGQPIDALKDGDPPISVADHEWSDDYKLMDYKVSEKDQLFGSDLRCQVQLSLRSPKGKELKKKATYSVGTNNALTVVREDDD
jgi:hypothetical protein